MTKVEEPTTSVDTVTINGIGITSSQQQIKCRFGPDSKTGAYVESTITLQSYELICKNAGLGQFLSRNSSKIISI